MNAPAAVRAGKWTAWPWTTAIAAGFLFLAGVFNRDVNAWLFLLLMATDWASEASPCGDAGPFEKLV